MAFTVFFYIFLATAIVSFWVSFLAWKRKSVQCAKQLAQLMFFAGFYSCFAAFEAASSIQSDKIYLIKMAYLGAVAVPVMYFMFIMCYTGHENVKTLKNIRLLFILPVITLILALTNDFHHLIWTGFSPIDPHTNLMVYHHGIWFWVGYAAYNYVLLILSTIALVDFILKRRNLFRTQGVYILIGGLCPWLAGLFYLTDINPFPGFDLAPVFTGISGILMVFAIRKIGFLDLVPIARETLMETLEDGIVALDSKNRIQDINQAACRFLGVPVDEKILGFTLESCDMSRKSLLEVVLSPESLDYFELTEDTDTRYFSIKKQPIHRLPGSRLIVIRDITEQITTQMEIMAGEERYRKTYTVFRLMADNMPDMLWAKDLDKKFTFVNKATCEHLLKAVDTEEPIGKTDLYFKDREQKNHPDEPDWYRVGVTCQSTDEKVLHTGKAHHFDEFGLVDGKPIYMDVRKAPIFDDQGQMIGIAGSARDVSKQKQIEQEIMERDRLLVATSKATALLIREENIHSGLRDALDILGEATDLNRIYIFQSFQPEGQTEPDLTNIYDWEDQYAVSLGIDRSFNEDFLAQMLPDWYELLHKGEVIFGRISTISPSIRRILDTQLIRTILIVPIFSDTAFWGFVGFDDCVHERDWSTAEINLLSTASNTIVSAYVRKKNQEELKIAKERAEESDRLKTAFLSNLSHEIRTPMNGILGFVSLLQEPNLTKSERKEYIHIVKEGSDRLLTTIHDIIDISKIESCQMTVDYTVVDINEVVQTICSLFRTGAEAKGLVLKTPVLAPFSHSVITTDKNKFTSIFSNLVKNAIKYTNQGFIEAGIKAHGNYVIVYVKDSGIGIPKDKQQMIFERFVQVDVSNTRLYEGLGLGLTISKAFVEMLGGKIWFETQEGVGSAFYFQLPVSKETSPDN